MDRVGCLYVDRNRCYVNDAKLGRRYLHTPALQVKYNLLDGYPSQLHYHQMKKEGLHLIQHFLEDHQSVLNDVDFVARRDILSKIMDMADGEEFEFCYTRVDNVIYMTTKHCEMPSAATATKDRRIFSQLKFEQCIFADKRGTISDSNVTLSNAEGWHVVLKLKFGEFNAAFSAKIDGIDPENSKSDKFGNTREFKGMYGDPWCTG